MKKIKHNEGYIFIKAPQWWKGKIYSKMYCFEHHYIYFINTGILPTKGEIIHHIDGNKENNSFTNLKLLKLSDHNVLHNVQNLAILKCPSCQKIYKRKYRDIRRHKRWHRAIYCSKSCASIMTRSGRPDGLCFEMCFIQKIEISGVS